MRILIAEDDDDIRDLLQLILSSEGHDVEVSADGCEALERLRAGSQPSLIILDMMMPRLDGEGFLRAMRNDPNVPDIPVVIISGHQAARQKAAEFKVAGCLVKPIELDELSALVRSVGGQGASR